MNPILCFVITVVVFVNAETENSTESNIGKIPRNRAKVIDVTNVQGSDYLPVKTNSSKLFVGDVVVDSSNNDELDFTTIKSQELHYSQNSRIKSLDWLMKLYNPYHLGNIIEFNTSKSCTVDMNGYVKALEEGQLWAVKMMDVSGRYTSQLFYGNNFWLGSELFCRELSNPLTNKQVPPYSVSFKVTKLLIKLPDNLTPKERIIFLGMCLPKSCTNQDVNRILTAQINSTPEDEKHLMRVINVRSVPGDYSLLSDGRFHALGGSMLVVLFMMIIGSSYDYFYASKKTKKESDENGDTKRNESHKDIENNNGDKKSAFEFNSKTNIYEVNKKENLEEMKKTDEKMKDERKEINKGLLSEILLSFSVYSNAKKILNCSKGSEDSLTSVHGLRFFSLTWVILVHTYLQLFQIGENKALRTLTERTFMYQTIGNATFSVDSFFFISGLLLAYLYFKNESGKNNGRHDSGKVIATKFVHLVLYRFIRLTPVYIVVLGMIQLSMTFINNNSVFEPNIGDHLTCKYYWWRNILYVNNLFPRSEMCMLWSWYMATDTQFFILSALLLLLAKQYFKFSAVTLFVILLSSWCTTAFISYTNQYQALVQEPFALFDELYDKPWTRIGPYIVGMCAGWLLYQKDCKINMSVPVVILGWTSSLACLLSLVYGIGEGLGVASSSVYVSLGHTAWGLCLAWIVVACRCGYGGWVNSFLSSSMLYPLSRLTYCAYLVHPFVMVLTSYVMDGPFHMHNGFIVIVFLGNVVASFLLSFLLSLSFEAPIVRLLKIIMTPKKR